MGKSDIGISNTPEVPTRPSLLSAGGPASDHNILDAVASRPGSRNTPRKPRAVIWLMLPLLAAAAWGISTQWQKSPSVRTVAVVSVPPVVPPPEATVSAPANMEPTGPATQPATTPTKLPASNAGPASQEPAPFDLQAALDAPNSTTAATSNKEVVSNTPLPLAQASQQPAASSPPKVAAVSPPKPKPPVAKSASPATAKAATTHDTTQRATSKPAPAVAQRSAGADPDVELLNAIMKHLGNGQGTTATGRSPQTIAELVKTCRESDAIEALLCRRRICEGSWGKAQACPMELAPKSTAKATAAPSNN